RNVTGVQTCALPISNVSSEQIEATKERLGLNQSPVMQYFQWLGQIIQLNFGTSYQTGEPVIKALMFYTPPTLIIAVLTIAIVFRSEERRVGKECVCR